VCLFGEHINNKDRRLATQKKINEICEYFEENGSQGYYSVEELQI
jgi:hypothetical protein